MNVCSFAGCGIKAHGNGLCDSHYGQVKRGHPLTPLKHRPDVLAWVVAHANYNSGECLTWPFNRNKKTGYGAIKTEHFGTGYASRAMCIMAHGQPPTLSHEAAHSCGNGHLGCVNPRHLRWATSVENKADELIHGTRNRGERQGHAKMTGEQVIAIREFSHTLPQKTIASLFEISVQHVSEIVLRRTWRHI